MYKPMGPYELSGSLGHRVNTEKDDHLRVYCLVTSCSGQLSLVPLQDRKWLQAKGQWQCFVAGKVTVGMVSYLAMPHCGMSTSWLHGPGRERSTTSTLSKGYDTLHVFPLWTVGMFSLQSPGYQNVSSLKHAIFIC